jgi:hypothetical protein
VGVRTTLRTRLVDLLYQSLPARLHNARNLSFESERTEAETANAELTKVSPGTTAELAAVVLTGLELRLTCVFDALCCSCHNVYLYPSKPVEALRPFELRSLAEGHTKALEQCASAVVVLGCRHDGDVHALNLVDLRVIDLGEDELIAQAQRIVATSVEALR